MVVSMGKGWKPKFLLQNLSEEEKEETISNVAWRMINIYRQLHIFSKEDIESYNQILLGIDTEVQMLVSEYPGGAEVARYLAYLKGQDAQIEKPALGAKEIAEEKAKARILADALAEKEALSGEKVIKVQVDGNSPGGVATSDAFAGALPPIPIATSASMNIDNVTFDENSMESMLKALASAQSDANAKNATAMADAVAKAIASSQESSANVIADALSKLSTNIGTINPVPIDVQYSPVAVPSGESAMDAKLLASFATDISEKIATTLASSISASQESNTKALADIVNSISADNKGVDPEAIATAIAKGMEGINLGSVKMEIDKPLKMEVDSPLKMEVDGPLQMEGSTSLEVSGATINATGGSGMSEDMVASFAKAFANAQLEVSQTQTASLAEAFSRAFSDAQIEVSQVQTDNLATAFAKAVTLSQSEMSSSLQDIVQELAKSPQTKESGISAKDLSEIVNNAIGQLQNNPMVQSSPIDSSALMSEGMSQSIEKMMSSFTNAQLQMSQAQNENIEKTLEAIVKSMPALNEKIALENKSTVSKNLLEDKSSDTYKETWIGGDFSSDIDESVNSDVFDDGMQNNLQDELQEVSLKEAMSSDPYNLLLKQKKMFKEHRLLYDSEVGLHIAYSGTKQKNEEGVE